MADMKPREDFPFKRKYNAKEFIEGVSPSSETHDYFRKFQVYFKYGVKEYWIVNPITKKLLFS